MIKVLVIGSGDLGRQIAHYISDSPDYKMVGYVDDWKEIGNQVDDYPILGHVDDIEYLYKEQVFDKLLVGIGYNHFETRKNIFVRFDGRVPFASYIHPSCYVDNTAKIGNGVIILPRCVIDMQSVIQDNVFVYSGSVIGHNSVIGFNSILSLSVTTGGFANIGHSCFIGLGSNVRDHINIADNTFVGSASNVIIDIVKSGVYVGNPVKFLRDR